MVAILVITIVSGFFLALFISLDFDYNGIINALAIDYNLMKRRPFKKFSQF